MKYKGPLCVWKWNWVWAFKEKLTKDVYVWVKFPSLAQLFLPTSYCLHRNPAALHSKAQMVCIREQNSTSNGSQMRCSDSARQRLFTVLSYSALSRENLTQAASNRLFPQECLISSWNFCISYLDFQAKWLLAVKSKANGDNLVNVNYVTWENLG